MPTLTRTKFRSKAELGVELQRLSPRYAREDPEVLADRFLRKHPEVTVEPAGPEGYSDISLGETLGNILPDLFNTAGETAQGIGEILTTRPDKTIGGLAKVAGGGIDVLAGTNLTSPQSQEAARAVGREFMHSLSPEGIQERPVNAVANVAGIVSPRALLAALGKAGKLGKVGTALRAAKFAESAPIGNAMDAAKAVGGMGKRGYRRAADAASTAAIGQPGRLERMAVDTIGGFMSGEGERSASAFHDLLINQRAPGGAESIKQFERARNLSGPLADKNPVGASRMAEKVQDEIIGSLLKGRDAGRTVASQKYVQGLKDIDLLDEKVNNFTWRGTPFLDAFRDDLARTLKGRGVVLVPKGKTAPRTTTYAAGGGGLLPQQVTRAARRPTWKVHFQPEFSPNPAGDAGLIRRELTGLVNTNPKTSMQQFHMARVRLDRRLRELKEGPAFEALLEARDSMDRMLKTVVGGAEPRYIDVLDEYSQANNRLNQIDRAFKLKPGVLDKKGMVHYDRQDRESIISAVLESFSDAADRRLADPGMLADMERLSGDPHIRAKVLGTGYARGMGRGLVQRGQASGMTKTLGTVLIGGGVGAMAGIPGAILGTLTGMGVSALYSPRLGSSMLIAGSKYLSKPPNPGAIRRAVGKIQQNARVLLNDPRSGPIIRAGLQEGWSIEKTMQRLEEQGLDIEAILNPRQAARRPAPVAKKKPTMFQSLNSLNTR